MGFQTGRDDYILKSGEIVMKLKITQLAALHIGGDRPKRHLSPVPFSRRAATSLQYGQHDLCHTANPCGGHEDNELGMPQCGAMVKLKTIEASA